MAQYAHALVDERSFPVLTPYYQRADTNIDATEGTNATTLPLPEPLQHGQTNWPGYFSDPSATQPSPNFASYVGTSASASSSSYASLWQQHTSPAVTAVGSSVSNSNFSTRVYHPSGSYEAPFEPPLLPDYPTSSQRTILPPSPSPHARRFFPLYGFRNDRHRSPSSHTSFEREIPVPAVDEHQYLPRNMDSMVDEDQSAEQETESIHRYPSVPASTTTTTSSHSVKIEPSDPDSCFIMELPTSGTCGGGLGSSTSSARAAFTLSMLSQSLAPPTEVPLRATQASKEMKRMMGVFRLNPFAMHSLSVKLEDNEDGLAWDEDSQPPWCGGRPLEEEPLMFEFQLDLNGSDSEGEDEQGAARQVEEESRGMGLGAHELSQLRSFSPSFELHPESIDVDTCDQESLGDDTSHLEEEEDQEYDQDQDRRSESWGDGSNHSEVDTNSTTTTPSVHTPFNDSPDGIQQAFSGYAQRSQHTSSPPVWDPVGAHYQVTEECHSTNSVSAMTTLPVEPKLNAEFGYANVRGPRSHTTISHPYLRKSLQNHQTTHSHSHNLSHPPIQSQSHPHPSPGFSLLPQPAHPSQGQVYLHHPSSQSEHNEHALRLHFSYANEPDRVYAPVSTSSSSPMMGDVQRVDEALPPYVRLIRSRYQDLDQGQHMSTRSMSGASKGVGGYGSSETTSHLSTLVHSHQPSGLVSGHGVNRRWSLPETGVMHSGPFLSGGM